MVRSVLAFACVALAALMLPAPVTAQGDAGVTWYVHGLSDPYGAEAFLDLAPHTEDEADQTTVADPAPAPVTFTVAEKAASGPYKGIGTTATAKLWMKGFNGAPSPGTQVTVELLAGTTSLGAATVTQDIANPVDSIVEYAFEITVPAGLEIAAGDKLSMVVTYSNEACGCFLGLAYPRGVSTDHPWQFTLPVAPATSGADAVKAVYKPVTGAFNETLAGPSLTLYNWTSSLSAGAIAVRGQGNGTATILVTDAANKTVFSKTLAGANTTRSEFAGATPGNWTVKVDARAYTGPLSVAVEAPATTGTTTTGTSRTATTGTTAAATSTSETPLGAWLPLLALGAAVLVLRRRLA